MRIPVFLFLLGFVMLIKGGDWFVDGAAGLAHRFHLPELLIGATVVSIGTTLPEVMVSAQAGDVVRCDDGANYTIMDVSQYDKNYFSDGPVGPLPTAACGWNRFDQPERSKAAKAPHFPPEPNPSLLLRWEIFAKVNRS